VSEAELGIEREEVLIADGSLIGRYHLYRATRPAAELFEAVAPVPQTAQVVIDSMRGWNLTTTDADLAEELVSLGALPQRRYALMSVHLDDVAWNTKDGPYGRLEATPLTPDLVITPQLIELIRRAYPPGHPDQELGTDEDIRGDLERALHGERLGTLMPVSRLVMDEGRPVGMAIVNRVPGRAPTGGPWLTDICRDPAPSFRGLGHGLLAQILRECRDSGETTMSLAVTEGNPARQLYESFGFTVVASTSKLRLPD
jgi:GNAT superfamily N-acetyltransferase